MKKLSILIIFSIILTLGVKADEYEKKSKIELNKMGVYFGHPLENLIVASGDM